MKKILSLLLCTVLVFGIIECSDVKSPVSLAITVEAATEITYPYYYYQLNENQRKTYGTIRAAVLKCDASVAIDYAVSGSDLQLLADLLYYYDPVIFNISDINANLFTKSTIIYFTYNDRKENYDKKMAAIEKAANNIISKIPEGTSVYNKLKFIHDEIINTCGYNMYSADSANPYGALIRKEAKCDGYSRAFSYICNKLGIRTVMVIGNDITEGATAHMWNKVYYNKNWYNVDVTFDDPISPLADNLKYNYFMVSDAYIKKTHSQMNIELEVPAAEDDTKAYYKVAGYQSDDVAGAKELLKTALLKSVKKQKAITSIQLTSKEAYEKTITELIDKKGIEGILSSVSKNAVNKFIDSAYLTSTNDNIYTIDILIFFYDTPLSNYYSDTNAVGKDIKSLLASYGIS